MAACAAAEVQALIERAVGGPGGVLNRLNWCTDGWEPCLLSGTSTAVALSTCRALVYLALPDASTAAAVLPCGGWSLLRGRCCLAPLGLALLGLGLLGRQPPHVTILRWVDESCSSRHLGLERPLRQLSQSPAAVQRRE